MSGVARSLVTLARTMEREARRQQRILLQQFKEQKQMLEKELVALEVKIFKNYLDVITSFHKECSEKVNWEELANNVAPQEPEYLQIHEDKALLKLENYKPSFIDRLFKIEEKQRESLKAKIEKARKKDEDKFDEQFNDYKNSYEEWKNCTKMASGVLDGNLEMYIEVIKEINPFAEIGKVGSNAYFQVVDKNRMIVTLNVNEEKTIPKEVKTQLQSGKLSVKPMPVRKIYELYQDHICSAVLRIAREIFALLPIEYVIINAVRKIVSDQIGHLQETTILSVLIPKETFSNITWEHIDPSDFIANFVHRMDFKKASGFIPVEPIDFSNYWG
jgi:hypothetical protein